jgi:imidazoleglycerol phosphate synthase glutamine amidotransferase subunit HisH
MAVTKRSNDPNYGIVEEYVDPAYFVHSFTDDPTFSDIIYAGHMKRMSISELKRIAGDQFTEEQYETDGTYGDEPIR